MIDGVKIVALRQIVDERGKIMHMLKATDPHFIKFGEIYFSCAWPGTVKAWHIHKSMTVNNAVISGRAKLVMYDGREGSPTFGEVQEVFMGEDNYVLVQIPPGITNWWLASTISQPSGTSKSVPMAWIFPSTQSTSARWVSAWVTTVPPLINKLMIHSWDN